MDSNQQIENMMILGALDSLAVCLADHGHVWTDGERAIYEEAAEILKTRIKSDDSTG